MRALLLLGMCVGASAVLPTSQVDITSSLSSSLHETYYASAATFGVAPLGKERRMTWSSGPSSDKGLCSQEVDSSFSTPTSDFVMLVERGNCTFQNKAANAMNLYGASSVVIYNTIEQMYSRNKTALAWPIEQIDYECSNGESYVDPSSLDLPYFSRTNDNIFASSGCSSDSKCSSNLCVLTGKTSEGGNGKMRACCAWDLHQYLYGDPSIDNPAIPTVFITINEADSVFSTLETLADAAVLSISERPRPNYNISSFILWAMVRNHYPATALALYCTLECCSLSISPTFKDGVFLSLATPPPPLPPKHALTF